MSLTHDERVYLMAYVDGQVDDDEIPEVEALLAKSEEARSIVAQHAAMGDWVRASTDERAVSAGADGIADVVLHDIEKLGGGKVISLERERAKVALNRQRTKEFGALAAVAAVAAAVGLMPTRSAPVAVTSPRPALTAPASTSPRVAPAPVPASSGATAPEATVAAGGEPAPESDPAGVDVQNVESPSHPFSIFYVHGSAGLNAQASSVVVWIAE